MIALSAGKLPRTLKTDFLRSLPLLSLFVSASAAALIWSAPAARAQSMDELYEKAKLEKSVALVAAGPSEPYEHWIREFQQRDFVRWKREGALLSFRPEGFDQIDPAFKDEDGAFTTVSVNMVAYAYNTVLLAPADVPRSALDFLKPVFQGKLVTTDPSEDDASLLTFRGIVEKYGWDYLDNYMDQKPSFVINGHAAVSNAIADGQKLATFDSTSTTPRLKRDGKPIDTVLSKVDAIPVFLVAAAIFRDAPHPNGAKLFLNWYLAREQQSRTGTFSPRADVPPPDGFQPLASYAIDSGYREMLSDEVKLAELKKRIAGYLHR